MTSTMSPSSITITMKLETRCANIYILLSSAHAHLSYVQVLSYADIGAIYELENGSLWVEHGYLWDGEDVMNCHKGKAFAVKKNGGPVKTNELVDTKGLYHSYAYLIEDQVRLFPTEVQANHHRGSMFCQRAWDASTGKPILDNSTINKARWQARRDASILSPAKRR